MMIPYLFNLLLVFIFVYMAYSVRSFKSTVRRGLENKISLKLITYHSICMTVETFSFNQIINQQYQSHFSQRYIYYEINITVALVQC